MRNWIHWGGRQAPGHLHIWRPGGKFGTFFGNPELANRVYHGSHTAQPYDLQLCWQRGFVICQGNYVCTTSLEIKDQGPRRGRGTGASAPHFFGNSKELLRKRCFQPPHFESLVSPPPPPPTFKVATRALKIKAIWTVQKLQTFTEMALRHS